MKSQIISHNAFLFIIYFVLFAGTLILLYICISIIKYYKEKGLLSKVERERLKQEKLEEEKLASEFKQFNKGLTNN